jgi:hypothetical protein
MSVGSLGRLGAISDDSKAAGALTTGAQVRKIVSHRAGADGGKLFQRKHLWSQPTMIGFGVNP